MKKSKKSPILLGIPSFLWYNENSKKKEFYTMSSGRNDIRLIELKDTISQLNQTIRVQTEMIKDLRKTIEEHHASDEKKDQIISNLQAEISYLKAKLFGASSEKRRKEDLPG